MKKKLNYSIFILFIIISFIACKEDNQEDMTSVGSLKIQQPTELEKKCSYVDGSWSPGAILTSGLLLASDTQFMTSQLTAISIRLWSMQAPTLGFIVDPSDPNSTYNAVSYSNGKIYYGYAIYNDAKTKGGADNIINVMILAHEFAHQLQFRHPQLPSIKETTARATELEADGMAGYYLGSPTGYNKTDFTQIAQATNFVETLGDNNTTHPDHHGTASQRRSAVRLGFLLRKFDFVSAFDFDYYFFYFYENIKNGAYKTTKLNSGRIEIDSYMGKYMDELRQILAGEINAQEFEMLNN